MKRFEHPFLDLPVSSLRDGALSKALVKNLKFPKRKFPPQFLIKKKNSLCGGYFICYDRKITPEEVAGLCEEGNWQFLANLVGDFLIIFCDYSKRELFLLTDQAGKFPCYFSLTDNKFLLSTDFVAIKNALTSLSLNVSSAFDYFATGLLLFPTDETLISEIHQVPPGTLLKINSDLSYSLEPVVVWKDFLAEKEAPYTSIKKFTNDFFVLLRQLVNERLAALSNLSFAAALSSGLDSSLIVYFLKNLSKYPFTCYSRFWQQASKDTDPPRIVADFAKKHGLIVKFINEDGLYPFSKDKYLEMNARYPFHLIGHEMIAEFFSKVAKDGNQALFTGDGGDEAYWSYSADLWIPFSLQQNYFLMVGRLDLGIGKILTEKGLEIFLNRERFARKKIYPGTLSTSAVGLYLHDFPLAWETGVWPLTPFIDPRLVQLMRRIPRRGSEVVAKEEILKHRTDIFVARQFRPRGGLEEMGKLYLIKRPNLVISILKDSILGKTGWIRASEIIDNIQKGDIRKYFEDDAYIYLLHALRLEYFLQHNRVKI